ncbi:MAG: gliding motility-associated ABC transporter substrate-binding protein GldG [Flavobacteriaceae bacterium]|jgi:gliding-associated putative ABC transporter substrate-binding component GldG|nr:gliding motility-associated ABC transporter substrate-binding protein GldG [Flavobacteriaceae bacterium]
MMGEFTVFIKKNVAFLILILLGVIFIAGLFYQRLDLTADKRYTLTDASKKVLEKIEEPMQIDIYLDGDFPADFKQLQSETISLLDEMRRLNSNISYQLIDPIKENISEDTLQAMGILPSNLQVEKGQITIFPYATVRYKKYGMTVPLIVEQAGISSDEQITKSIESLEYSFVNIMDKITHEHLKSVGILVNQKELNRLEMYSFASRILQSYNFGPVFPKDSQSLKIQDLPALRRFDAVVIAKPRKAFTDEEKMVIDQYIMHGGKTLWALSAVNAEMDTLLKSSKILAYPYDLNLTDLLFAYGVRINPVLIKDIQRPAPLNLQVGSVQGNAQNARVPWVYFPLGFPTEDTPNPITKNINPVRFEFPSPIDTLETEGVKKTILYQSSPFTDVQGTPSYVSLEEAKYADKADSLNIRAYRKGAKIMAALLEGKFTSAYDGRIESSTVQDFVRKSPPNKMIVIADGNVAKNEIIQGQPVPLGLDYSTQITYGNEEFLMNALNYLLDDSGLMSLRNRTVQMRMLDKQSILMDKSYWQWLNLLAPLVFIWAIGVGTIFWRKRKFGF